MQHRWHSDAAALRAELDDGIDRAARLGATVVFLPELTLSRYPADTLPENDLAAAGPRRPRPSDTAEDLLTGPTFRFAAEAARRHGICRPRLALPARGQPGRLGRRPGPEHRHPGVPRRRTPGPHPQAAHPGDRRLLRGQVLPPGPGRGRRLPGPRPGRTRRRPAGHAHLLGRVVPRAGPHLLPRRRRAAGLPDGHRLRAATTRTSTPSRCGSRSSSATASPTACSWWSRTAGAARAR